MYGPSWQKSLVLAGALLITVAVAVPASAFVLSPLWQAPPSPWLLAAPLHAIPDNGEPGRFPLRELRRDAWSVRLEDPRGEAFLRREPGSGRVLALRTYHLSNRLAIAVVYDEARGAFRSVCRKVLFDLEGRLQEANKFRYLADDMQVLKTKVEGNTVFVALE